MTEPKWTPGPWERMGQSLVWAPGAKQVVAQASEPEPDCGWVSFQTPSLGGPHHSTIVANARLIAAAPALLAACKKQEEANHLWEIGFSNNDDGKMLERVETWLATEREAKELRQAAIAKAEGRDV